MRRTFALFALFVAVAPPVAAEQIKPLVSGLKAPTAVAPGPDGRMYVAVQGEVLVLAGDKAVPFAKGLDRPAGLVAWKDALFATDSKGVWQIDRTGKATLFAEAAAFPKPPQGLAGLTVDERGVFYVADTGGALYRLVTPRTRPGQTAKPKVELVFDSGRVPALKAARALGLDGMSFLLVLDANGALIRLRLADGEVTQLPAAMGAGGGVAWDWRGRLYLGGAAGVSVIARPGEKPVRMAAVTVSGLGVDPEGKAVYVTDSSAGTVTALPAQVPGAPVDETPLALESVPAFPDLQWAGWDAEPDSGKVIPLRPIMLTHAGDGSNRVFVPTQHGVVHVFPNDQKATKTQVFLDLQGKVFYSDNENEQGFLGMAFHPRYQTNGEFYAFYTDKKAKQINVLSRFRVSKDDPNRADPASEEELLRIQRPFWNHDGGTIVFGPDGFLYVALGDGGAANDPHGNGQKLSTILGKVLRIDVNRKEGDKAYGIPPDNPFVGRGDAKPEIFCYGLRNVWRMAFDPKTGALWAGEVGQNLYEEINLLTKGGNYGWNLRESFHPFGPKGADVRPDLVEPIWEYHHDIGKSITGGSVYRGKQFPELEGHYVYADYVSSRIWALKYDEAQKRVTANRPLPKTAHPVLSFGEDERGELYWTAATPTGRGLWRFARTR